MNQSIISNINSAIFMRFFRFFCLKKRMDTALNSTRVSTIDTRAGVHQYSGMFSPTKRTATALGIFFTGVALIADPTPACAQDNDLTRAGTFLKYALPAAVLGYSYMRDDTQGMKDYGKIWVVNELTVEALKSVVTETRPADKGKPNFTGKRKSFPSGHAASAFGSAFFIAQRYGWRTATPWLAGAAVVGYSRVDAGAHYWRDVAASAAISYGFAVWLTEPLQTKRSVVVPAAVGQGAGVVWLGSF
jgi:membrane-associated phospholipid phosphatase